MLRIWQVHQPSFTGDISVTFGAGDRSAARAARGRRRWSSSGSRRGDFALLRQLRGGGDLAAALDAAMAADAMFDLGTALRDFIANRTLADLRSE